MVFVGKLTVMKKSSFNKMCQEHKQKNIAIFMGVTKSAVSKYNKLGYPPSDWDFNLSMLSEGKYTQLDWVTDRATYKTNSKPMVNNRQVTNFLAECMKLPAPVGILPRGTIK